ncbi:triosephosphate isomerase [Actinomycetota bacterium]|nr:triosephosphate isomerase [Actinomycetota bacterium]
MTLPPGRPVWLGTSWKMTKTLADATAWARAVAAAHWAGLPTVRPFVLPPATALTAVRDVLVGSPVEVGAQNAHWADAGAWTGEVSVPQVRDAGAVLVEIGHSERRAWFGETDRTVNLKVHATLRHGLTALVCVGEPEAAFRAGRSVEHVLAQTRAALADVTDLGRVLVAYEPVWAIGEQGRPARPDEVAGVVAALAAEVGPAGVRLLYGGSVDTSNAADLLAVPGLDGLFVGRAAWAAEGFLALAALAATAVR